VALAVIGALLLIAAGHKVYGASVSALPPVGRLSTPIVQLAAVLWELGLGSWLIAGVARSAAWIATVVSFALFALVSGSLGLQGVGSCGCFGVITASPWAAFGVDLVVLIGLLLFRPPLNGVELKRFAKPALRTLAGTAALVGVGTLSCTLAFGSVSAAVAKLRGESVDAPEYLNLGTGTPGQTLQATADVTNYTNETIRLIGGTSDCACITTATMPLTIEPSATAVVSVSLRIPPNTNTGTLTRTAEFWTDCPGRRTIKLRLGATVVPAE